jgi:PAS domain S-box-containing protein
MGQLRDTKRLSEASARETKAYRETLQQNEARLQGMIDNCPAVIYLKDTEGRFILINRRAEAMLGVGRQQAAGMTEHDFFPREVADRFREHDREVLTSGRALEWEDELSGTDGPRTYLTIKFPLFDRSGRPYAVGGFSTDITERKRAERALSESEQRFRSLSACSPVGIFLTDVRGETTYTNPRCQEIFGFSLEESMGDGWGRFIHPDDRNRVLDYWAECSRNGKAFALEYRTSGAQGSIRWVRDRTAPMVTDRGEIVGHVGTVADITDQRRAEDEVRRERDFAEGLIATAQAIVMVLDRHGRIVRVNPFLERMTGQPPEEVRGLDWFESFVVDRDRPAARAAFERALAKAEGSHSTHSIVATNGRELEVEWASRALDGVVGDVPGVLAIGHDITALKQAQQRALQAERLAAIGQMVTGLAHESRNALQRSQACLEMLALRVKDRPEPLELVGGIQEALDDLNRLYEEVRSYAAPIILDRRECDLRDILHEAWTRLEPMRQDRDACLQVINHSDPTCAGDHFRLVQVFRNIMDNSLGATRELLLIEAELQDSYLGGQTAVTITVRDNGPGLSAEQQANLFEPFYTTKIQGTGLGMAIAKRNVEAHGGMITIVHDRDRGASIEVSLPRGRK